MEFQPQVQCVAAAEDWQSAGLQLLWAVMRSKLPPLEDQWQTLLVERGWTQRGSNRTGFLCYSHRKLLQ